MRQPKCALVSSKLIAETGRLDPGFYLGNSNELRERLRARRHAAKVAIGKYRAARQAMSDEDARMKEMLASGEIEVLAWRDP